MEDSSVWVKRTGLFLLGLGGLLGLCVGLLAVSFTLDRQAARYPEARQISSHSNFQPPFRLRWDDTYATDDPINLVYRWYSVKFDLGAESHANGNCSLIEDVKIRYAFTRTIHVVVCETGIERLIFVNRETSWR